MDRYSLKRRSISDAVYLKNNPNGDPFSFSPPKTLSEARLYGIGLGLYWGEGTKASKNAIRLGNTDPLLIKAFLEFLVRFFNVDRKDVQYGLQIFTDIDPERAVAFWQKTLSIGRRQFYKPTITKSGSIGTYRKKSEYGVLTLYYHNKKLRELFSKLMPR